jgi:ATP/maltotriose-dependent transcriptional regulator MalT/DNA-binding SARP family transcriptional activator
VKWFLPQKVIRPYAPSALVERPRLHEGVLANLDRKLTLMVAPAGYGKSVLALEIAKRAPYLDCWYELDEHDAHLETFYAYLCEAVRQRVPSFLEELPETPKSCTPWELAGLFTATLYRIGEPLLLTLSNFHRVGDADAVTRFVDTLITYLPPTCHLMILSRSPTQLNLARLVANQEVTLLTQAQLALTPEESVSMAELLGCSDVARAEALHAQLGGWAAGLSLLLAGESSRRVVGGAGSAEGLIRAYLETEVLGELSDEERRFAFLAALLAPFSELEISHYCTPEERLLLPALVRRHALLFATGRTRGAEALYDMQPLVKGFLKETLEHTQPELWRELNLKVGVGRFDAGHVEALQNLVAAGAVGAIVERLEGLRRTFRESGDYSRFALWLKRLPEAALQDHPELLILMGEALVQSDAAAARALYSRALELGVRDRRLHAAALSGLLRAEHNLRHYRELLARAPEVLTELRELRELRELAFSYNSVARAHMSLGQFSAAARAFEMVQRVGDELRDPYFKTLATRGLAAYAEYTGDTQRALLLNQQALSFWEARGNSYQIAGTLNSLAACYYDLGEFEAGLSAGLRALSLWNDLALDESPVLLHCTLGDLLLALGRPEEAARHFDAALYGSPTDAFAHVYALVGRGRLCSLEGGEAKAKTYAERALELALAHGLRFCEGLARTLLAQLAALQGSLAEAAEQLGGAERLFTEIGARRELTRVLWLLSSVAQRRGADAAPLAARARALEEELGCLARPLRCGSAEPEALPETAAPSAPKPSFGLLTSTTVAPRAVLELFTCGHTDIVLNGEPVAINDWNGRKPRDVVLFLASVGGGASRDEFVEALWDDEGRDPEQQFSVALSRARRTLGWREAIVRDGNLYRFSAELHVREDAGTLEALRPGAPVTQLMEALDAYRGDYLPGYYANWVERRRQSLQEHVLLLLADLLPRLGEEGQRHLIPAYAKLAFKLDPCHEPSTFELIRYHLENRNLEQARRQFHLYEEAITELGLEPSPIIASLLSRDLPTAPPRLGERFLDC